MPTLSNMSMNIRLKILPNRLHFSAPRMSSLKATAWMLKLTDHASGMCTLPRARARPVDTTTPINRAPLIRLASRKIMTSRPTRPMPTVAVRGPALIRVTGSPMTRPRFRNPMNVMNRPMPTEMAEINASGMASTSLRLSPSAVSIIKNTPERNTTPRAVCQVTPSPRTRLYAKNALSPMPGAMAIGALANSPTAMVARALTTQVAAITASLSMPVPSARIEGLTKMM